MGKTKDLTGLTFGRLTVISWISGTRKNPGKWRCKCICGNYAFVTSHKLISGHTQSCGCLQKERTSQANKTHGLKNTSLYGTWCNMKQRCYNVNNNQYHAYGGRGITICNEWLNDFQAFYNWAIDNGYKPGLTIERINVNGNYEPSNCTWIPNAKQGLNKTNTVRVTLLGVTLTLVEWCEYYNRDYQQAYDKIIRYKLMTPEEFFGKEVV